jgi:hypothetical protein
LLSALAAFAWHQGRWDIAIAMGGAVLLLVLLAVEGIGTATSLASVEIARLGDRPEAGSAEQESAQWQDAQSDGEEPQTMAPSREAVRVLSLAPSLEQHGPRREHGPVRVREGQELR